MERYKILIVEDEINIAESLQEIIEILDHDVVGIADSADTAIAILEKEEVDLALLDIQIRGAKDGVELAESIKSRFKIPYIFTTAYADNETIRRASNQSPYGYLVKPYGIKDINAAIEVAISNYQEFRHLTTNEGKFSNNQLFVKVDSRLVKINIEDVLYVEAKGDYALFKTEKESFIIHSTIKNIETKLSPASFLKVHRSYIINIDKIIDIEDSNLLIKDKIIPISRSKKPLLMQRISLI